MDHRPDKANGICDVGKKVLQEFLTYSSTIFASVGA